MKSAETLQKSTSCCARLDLRTLSRLFLEFNLCDPEQPRLTRCHVATLSWTRCLTLDTDGYRGYPGPPRLVPGVPTRYLWATLFLCLYINSQEPCQALGKRRPHVLAKTSISFDFTVHDVSRCVTMCHDVLQFERFSTGTWRRADVQSAHQHKHSDGLRMFEMWTISMQKHAKSPSHGWGSGSPRRCTN